MTPQEESMLNDLIGRVEQTQLTEKDPEAEQLLNQRLGRNPNALYILAQTVLVQKYALEQAQAQLNQLRQQTQALSSSPPTPPASWAACWVTVILRLPRLHRPSSSAGLRNLALCSAVEPGRPRTDRLRLHPGVARAFCVPPLPQRPA